MAVPILSCTLEYVYTVYIYICIQYMKYMRTHIYIYMYICIYIYTFMYMYMHMYTFTYTYAYPYPYNYIHIHTFMPGAHAYRRKLASFSDDPDGSAYSKQPFCSTQPYCVSYIKRLCIFMDMKHIVDMKKINGYSTQCIQ